MLNEFFHHVWSLTHATGVGSAVNGQNGFAIDKPRFMLLYNIRIDSHVIPKKHLTGNDTPRRSVTAFTVPGDDKQYAMVVGVASGGVILDVSDPASPKVRCVRWL